MGGGIHPAEWIFPVVGASHAAYNAAAQQASPRAKIDVPGSSNARRDEAMENDRKAMEAARQAEAERQALVPRPQSGQEELESRKRAIAASEVLGGGRKRKTSQTLTNHTQTLSGLSREGV